jgi:hypothetical protein
MTMVLVRTLVPRSTPHFRVVVSINIEVAGIEMVK